MGLALPFTITDPVEPDSVQGNFLAIKDEFPLSRRHMSIETPHVVGAAGEPAFQGAWVNFDTATFRGARFWKDPMGLVHIEGLVKSGAIPSTIFILPAGYRPGSGLLYPVDTNTGHGRLDISPSGNLVAQSGGATYFTISVPPFKQES
jgi:hypothetical protein